MITLSIHDFVVAVAGISAIIIVGYCFYFVFALRPDSKKRKKQKRTSDTRLTWTQPLDDNFLR